MSEENCTAVWGRLRDRSYEDSNERVNHHLTSLIGLNACGFSIGYAIANRQLFQPYLIVEIIEGMGRELGQSVHIFIESKITSASV